MGALGQVSFFVSLAVVILVHEAAHFGVAKLFDIKVTEFFVGFGPRLWSTRRGETEYGVKAIPAGGYVKIAGMNPFEEVRSEDRPRTYGAKPRWQRALVIVAGPLTHVVLAFLCFGAWLSFVGADVARSPVVTSVAPSMSGSESPASAAGIRAGDRIVAVGDIENPTSAQLIRFTRDHVDEPISIAVLRDDRRMTLEVTPRFATVGDRKVGRIGVVIVPARQRLGPVASIAGAGTLVVDTTRQTVLGIGKVFGPEGLGRVVQQLFSSEPRRASDGGVVSVVGIGRAVGQTAERGHFGDILVILATVNIFIGLINLLPLPPFDGGHLAVLAIEAVRGRSVDMRKVAPVAAVVAGFFILFSGLVLYLDIVKPVNLTP